MIPKLITQTDKQTDRYYDITVTYIDIQSDVAVTESTHVTSVPSDQGLHCLLFSPYAEILPKKDEWFCPHL
jgi:hypothetical protein